MDRITSRFSEIGTHLSCKTKWNHFLVTRASGAEFYKIKKR